jgi:hypothetical protein
MARICAGFGKQSLKNGRSQSPHCLEFLQLADAVLRCRHDRRPRSALPDNNTPAQGNPLAAHDLPRAVQDDLALLDPAAQKRSKTVRRTIPAARLVDDGSMDSRSSEG